MVIIFEVILVVVVGQLIVFMFEAFNNKNLANITQATVTFGCIIILFAGFIKELAKIAGIMLK